MAKANSLTVRRNAWQSVINVGSLECLVRSLADGLSSVLLRGCGHAAFVFLRSFFNAKTNRRSAIDY